MKKQISEVTAQARISIGLLMPASITILYVHIVISVSNLTEILYLSKYKYLIFFDEIIKVLRRGLNHY